MPSPGFTSAEQSEQYAASGSLLKSVLANLPEVIYSYDLTDRALLFVSAAIRNYGHGSQQLLAAPSAWPDLIHPEDREWLRPIVRNRARKGQRMSVEYRFRDAGGQYHAISDSLQIEVTSEGHIVINGIMADISEAKRAQQSLEQASNRLTAITSAIPIVLFELNRDGVFTLSEGRGLAALGHKPGEVVGRTVFDVYRDYPDILDANRRALAGEQHTSTVNVAGVYFETHYVPLRTPSGAPDGVLGIAFDVTESKSAQADLESARQQMEGILENMDKVFFSIDAASMQIIYISSACAEIYGLPRQAFYDDPLTWRKVIHPADISRVDSVNAIIQKGGAALTEYRILQPDGTILWVDTHLKAGTDDSGKVVRIDGVVSDITERKHTEEALRHSEERFRRLFEESPLGIVITAPDLRFLEVNARFCEMSGYTPQELKSLTFLDITHDDDSDENAESARLAFQGKGRPVRGEKRFIKKNKETLWVMRSSAIIKDVNGKALYGLAMIEDITERKLREEEMARLNRELAEGRAAIEQLNHTLEEQVEARTEELRRSYIKLQERNRQLTDARSQAITDGLTGLRNHRMFQERIRTRVMQAAEEKTSVGLIMLDIDGFKQVNDSLGHLAGDDILRALSASIDEVVGHEDSYRYGGDEFAIICYGKNIQQTLDLAEQLRDTVERRLRVNDACLTISLGVAAYPQTADSVDKLMYGADAAMYKAKAAGKNLVSAWGKAENEDRPVKAAPQVKTATDGGPSRARPKLPAARPSPSAGRRMRRPGPE